MGDAQLVFDLKGTVRVPLVAVKNLVHQGCMAPPMRGLIGPWSGSMASLFQALRLRLIVSRCLSRCSLCTYSGTVMAFFRVLKVTHLSFVALLESEQPVLASLRHPSLVFFFWKQYAQLANAAIQ